MCRLVWYCFYLPILPTTGSGRPGKRQYDITSVFLCTTNADRIYRQHRPKFILSNCLPIILSLTNGLQDHCQTVRALVLVQSKLYKFTTLEGGPSEGAAAFRMHRSECDRSFFSHTRINLTTDSEFQQTLITS